MSTTLEKSLSEAVSEFFVTRCCDRVCVWLKENKGVDVTKEEMCKCFSIEYTPNKYGIAGLPSGSGVNIPSYLQGPTSSPLKRGGGRKKKEIDPNAPTCIYIFTRGKRKNDTCGNVAINDGSPGSDRYCKQCIGKSSAKEDIAGNSSSSNTVSSAVLPNGLIPVPKKEEKPENSLDAIAIEGRPGYCKLTNGGFIIREYPEGTGQYLAVCVEENGIERPLTADEKNKLQFMGISISDDNFAPAAVPQILN